MDSTEVSGQQGRDPATPALVRTESRPTRWLSLALIVSVGLLAAAPLVVAGTYSVFEHTLSESGGQGVDGGWVFRLALAITAVTVIAMTVSTGSRWSRGARWSFRAYAIALVGLAVFPESSFDGSTFDETVARLHTVAGVSGAFAFILGIALVSTERPGRNAGVRMFDWFVAGAVALVPQVMLFVAYDGLLQRLMVLLGYIWLLAESGRISSSATDPAPPDIARA